MRVFLVAEGGVHSREDAARMMAAGADALLVGMELMEGRGGWGRLAVFDIQDSNAKPRRLMAKHPTKSIQSATSARILPMKSLLKPP